MSEKERLTMLLERTPNLFVLHGEYAAAAEYLLANGGIVPPCEAIARLAELETRATPKPIMEQIHEFFIQGYLIKEIFYCCPNCGLDFGKHDPTRKIAHARYCESCGQALKWPKEEKDDKGTTENL